MNWHFPSANRTSRRNWHAHYGCKSYWKKCWLVTGKRRASGRNSLHGGLEFSPNEMDRTLATLAKVVSTEHSRNNSESVWATKMVGCMIGIAQLSRTTGSGRLKLACIS